jgi:hypothetical protein
MKRLFSIETIVFNTAGASVAERAPASALVLKIAVLAPRSKMIATTIAAKLTTVGLSAG